MDVLPLLQHIEPRTFQGGTRNIPAHAEEEELGAHQIVRGVVTICLRSRRTIPWRHGRMVVDRESEDWGTGTRRVAPR